jgi:hypothetical protein
MLYRLEVWYSFTANLLVSKILIQAYRHYGGPGPNPSQSETCNLGPGPPFLSKSSTHPVISDPNDHRVAPMPSEIPRAAKKIAVALRRAARERVGRCRR